MAQAIALDLAPARSHAREDLPEARLPAQRREVRVPARDGVVHVAPELRALEVLERASSAPCARLDAGQGVRDRRALRVILEATLEARARLVQPAGDQRGVGLEVGRPILAQDLEGHGRRRRGGRRVLGQADDQGQEHGP